MELISVLVITFLVSGDVHESEIPMDHASCAAAATALRRDLASPATPTVELISGRLVPMLAAECLHACMADGEPLQLLRYPVGGEYVPHHDYFDPAFPGAASQLRQGGQRIATVIVYLHEPEEGGATWFPELELSVRPRRGSAIYFEYHNARDQLDARCLHAGMPVLRGHKWIATKWLRQSPYANA